MRTGDRGPLRYLGMVFLPFLLCGARPVPAVPTVIDNMEAAWAGVSDYRTVVDVRTYGPSGSFHTQRFRYTFKTPDHIRLDFMKPHPGLVIIYPDSEGKVYVKPSGLAGLFRFHMSPGSPRLAVSAGQRVDQTDLGLLVKNIAASLTRGRRGPLSMRQRNGRLCIRVVALDHFRPGVVTSYTFTIDETLWLPVRVAESTQAGKPERIVSFSGLRVNTGVPDALFRTG